MQNLAKAIISENEKNNLYKLGLIHKVESADISRLDWRLEKILTVTQRKKPYTLDELKEVLKTRNKKSIEKQNIKDLENLNFGNFEAIETLIIKVEWQKSALWGMNPKAEAYIDGIGYVSSGSIGGCGYDKRSTSVALVLNQIPQFKKLMFELKNKNIKLENKDLFGYGSGSGVLPSFQGGVGVECYNRILNAIGYEFKSVASGKIFDVYQINKKQ